MAKVLLIDPPWYALQNISYCNVSYGLASIAAVLRENTHQCIIYNGEFDLIEQRDFKQNIISDFDLYFSNLKDESPLWEKTRSNLREIMADFKPHIVGITMPTAKYASTIKIANYIKRIFPEVTIVVGGPHPTILPLDTMQEPSIDIVVKKEGELSFLELVNVIERKESLKCVRGIVFKENSRIYENTDREYIENLDTLPFPAWDLIYKSNLHPSDSFGTLYTSRGCSYQCIYCASNKIWSRHVRYMSADRVVSELRYTWEKFGAKTFRLNDDTFILDKKRVEKICDKIKKDNIQVGWYCDVRADLCSYDILRQMKSAGCFRVNVGVESGSPKILQYINKGIRLEQIYSAFATIKKAKLESLAYFMVGFPNETLEQVQDTARLMKKLKSDFLCLCLVTPYPGTDLYTYASREGLLPVTQDWCAFFHHSPKMGLTKSIEHHAFSKLIRVMQDTIDSAAARNYEKIVFRRRLELLRYHPAEFIKKICGKILGVGKPK